MGVKKFENFSTDKNLIKELSIIFKNSGDQKNHLKLKRFYKKLSENSPIKEEIGTALDAWNGYDGEWEEYVEKALKILVEL